jgi:23S rRNA (cytosine1962-C5)-methyltransferase
MKSITLKKGKEKALLRRHPWIFSRAIGKIETGIQLGETVEITNVKGEWLARGFFSPHSQIRSRVWTFSPDESIDGSFFERRIEKAKIYRQKIFGSENSNAYRLINSESDGLPGLIVDKYSDWLVVQFLSAGVEFWRETIIDILNKQFRPLGIYERSDTTSRSQEGLPLRKGTIAGEEPPEFIEIIENGLKFLVDVRKGHKTGFYLDQKANRKLVEEHASGQSVLNCFSYTGGFGIYALRGGAKNLVNIDTSQNALDIATENIKLNKLESSETINIKGDVFEELRNFLERGTRFDLIILDPPKFVESKRQLFQGARGYKDINMLAFKLLKRGGKLFTFSCSGHVTQELFVKIVSDAASDAGMSPKILRFLTQSPDHPFITSFPESLYLKGLLLEI